MTCQICALRAENDELKENKRQQLVDLGGSYIRDEKDQMVITMYTLPTADQRKRLFALLMEIDGSGELNKKS